MKGRVYLVGAGCGHWELITLRGKKLLEQCDTVIYDSLIDPLILELAPEDAERICVGKRAGQTGETQENINNLLVEKAEEGRTVVRLKGGDPFVFGRGGEEILALREHNIDFSVVPGISSAIAVPELAGIPVTHRGVSQSVHIIAGHRADGRLDLSQYAGLDGTLVFLMGLGRLGQIAEGLINNGKAADTPAAVISKGAGAGQRVVRSDLCHIARDAETLEPPAVIVVGDTAGLDLMGTAEKPLSGVTVTVTGTEAFAAKLTDALEAQGAYVTKLDYLAVTEIPHPAGFDDALGNLRSCDWLILTSAAGARILFRRMKALQIDLRELRDTKIAAVGRGTAEEIKKHGIIADFIPKDFSAASLGRELSVKARKGEKALILRARKGSGELKNALDSKGLFCDDIPIYDTVGKAEFSAGYEVKSDYLTFSSPSGVRFFFDSGYAVSEATRVVCIGGATAEEAKRRGVRKCMTPEESTCEGVTEQIKRGVICGDSDV